MPKERWVLIGTSGWTDMWKDLSEYLGIKIKEIEGSKAVSLTNQNKGFIKKKINEYNKENNTDFFID